MNFIFSVFCIIFTEKETDKKEEGGKKEIQGEKKITPAEYRRLHP